MEVKHLMVEANSANNNTYSSLVNRTSRLKLTVPTTENGGVYKLPVVHPIESAPRCDSCSAKADGKSRFFDFKCPQCSVLVTDETQTSIAQLLAIARQWTPAVQGCMKQLISEILRRGAHADDRDGLTDM